MILEEVIDRYMLTLGKDGQIEGRKIICTAPNYDDIKKVFDDKVEEWRKEYMTKEIDDDMCYTIYDLYNMNIVDRFNKLNLL